MRHWANWIREDLGSRPYAWFRLTLSLLHPVIIDKEARISRILVEPHLIDAEFCKAWMPQFCWSGHPVVTVDQFLVLVDPFLPEEPVLDMPRITGLDLLEVARAKSLLLEAWMGGLRMR